MKIYKLAITNEDLKHVHPMYFQEERTVQAVAGIFNELVKKGKKLEWDAEEIEVITHEEALNQFLEGASLICKK